MTTSAPSFLNVVAIPLPNPLAPPVTTATFPLSLPDILVLLISVGDCNPGESGCCERSWILSVILANTVNDLTRLNSTSLTYRRTGFPFKYSTRLQSTYSTRGQGKAKSVSRLSLLLLFPSIYSYLMVGCSYWSIVYLTCTSKDAFSIIVLWCGEIFLFPSMFVEWSHQGYMPTHRSSSVSCQHVYVLLCSKDWQGIARHLLDRQIPGRWQSIDNSDRARSSSRSSCHGTRRSPDGVSMTRWDFDPFVKWQWIVCAGQVIMYWVWVQDECRQAKSSQLDKMSSSLDLPVIQPLLPKWFSDSPGYANS